MCVQVRATTPASCRVLPHVLSHIALSTKSKPLPQLQTLTLVLLRLTHHASSSATRAAAAACSPIDPEGMGGGPGSLTAQTSRTRRRSSKFNATWGAATKAAMLAASLMEARGRATKGGGGKRATNKLASLRRDDRWKEGSRLPDAWADDPAQDRLSVSVENGRDVGCAIALHALCTVYESVRTVLIGSVHNDTWYAPSLLSFSTYSLS